MSNVPIPSSPRFVGKTAPAPATTLTTGESSRAAQRRSVYALLIAISAGAMTGRVLAVTSVDQIGAEKVLQAQGRENWQRQRPFLSGNDRSRWLTARALVEKGTYAIDQFVTDPRTYPNWDTIDMVMHEDANGQPHLYSSKPPLLGTLYAGIYWAIFRVTGATLGTHPYEIGRGMILLVNVVPLVVYFFVMAGIVERFGRSDWGGIFVVAAATFGTFLTTFAVVINNHLPAAVSAAIALSAALRIWYEGDRRWGTFALCGMFAAFTAACELPALSFFALVSAGLLWKAPRQTLLAYLPAALVVVVAFFATNWFAHRSFAPPYAHRTHQPASAATDSAASADADYFKGEISLDSGQTVSLRGNRDNWYDYEFTRTDRAADKPVESYWRNPRGIDVGERAIGKYALNLLVGHHGIFSLTPIWLLSIPGVVLLAWRREYRLREAAVLIAALTVVCVTFFIFRPMVERNYGGMTSGFRWVFWLAPLWLFALLPTVDWLSHRRWGRVLGCILLALSVLSATYPVWNPWTQPWLSNLCTYMDW